jgi:hypothetical protein|tara:strand:- start:402 stop:530 length:129 start_codon:yes stop_codon:yes gene_type:complete
MEIQLFKVWGPGVVQEAVPQEAVPPVQTQWGIALFSAHFVQM